MERIPTQHSQSSGILFHSTVFHIALSGSSTTRNSDHVEQCARSGLQNAERTSGVGESRPRVRRAACVPLRAHSKPLCVAAPANAFCSSTHNATVPLKITRGETQLKGSGRVEEQHRGLSVTQKHGVSSPQPRHSKKKKYSHEIWSDLIALKSARSKPRPAADISLWA